MHCSEKQSPSRGKEISALWTSRVARARDAPFLGGRLVSLKRARRLGKWPRASKRAKNSKESITQSAELSLRARRSRRLVGRVPGKEELVEGRDRLRDTRARAQLGLLRPRVPFECEQESYLSRVWTLSATKRTRVVSQARFRFLFRKPTLERRNLGLRRAPASSRALAVFQVDERDLGLSRASL